MSAHDEHTLFAPPPVETHGNRLLPGRQGPHRRLSGIRALAQALDEVIL